MRVTKVMEDYMWTHEFLPQYKKIPNNRERETVTLLRELIKKMHAAGFAAAAIGRYMDKDHTTILHHLNFMKISTTYNKLTAEDVKMRALVEKQKIERKIELQIEKTRVLKEKKVLREKLIMEKLKEKALRSRVNYNKKKNAAKMRKKLIDSYRKGETFHTMSLKHKIPEGRIQGLLIYEPEYQKLKTHRNTHKSSMRPVVQYDVDGEKIAEFISIRSAAHNTGVNHVAIALNARKRIDTAGGYIWVYKDEAMNIPTPSYPESAKKGQK